jgi:hypothetical protein
VSWFLVKSPLQFLNAVEARAHYGVSDDDARLVLFRPDGGAPAEAQLACLIERFPWPEIREESEAESTRSLDARVFVGDSREPRMRRLARSLSPRRPVVLDDGNATLLIAQRRRRMLWRWTDRRATRITDAAHHRRVPVPQIMRDGLRPRNREFGRVEFFTIYPIRAGRHDLVEKNDLTVLRGLVHERTTPRPVFVGSSLVESGLMRASAYRACVAGAAALHPGMVYIAHRREDDAKLHMMASELGIDTIRPKYPIELELIDRELYPAPLLVVLSTASDTVPMVFPGAEVVDLAPAPDAILPANREIVAQMIRLQHIARMARQRP